MVAEAPEPTLVEGDVGEDTEGAALLDELLVAVRTLDVKGLTDERFRRQYGSLHFRLRQWFGSLSRAFQLLLKREVGDTLSTADVLGYLERWYRTGEPMTLSGLMLRDRHMAFAAVTLFGRLEDALLRAGIDPMLASYERRCDINELCERAFVEWGVPYASVSEVDIARRDPLFLARAVWASGSFEAFSREVEGWLVGQPELLVVSDRGQLSRLPLRTWDVTSRGGRGRLMPGVERVAAGTVFGGAGAGHAVALVSSMGRMLRVSDVDIRIVSSASGGETARGGNWKKGERTAGVCKVGGLAGPLALVTRGGRIKVVQERHLVKVREPGAPLLGLEGQDKVAIATSLGSWGESEGGRPERVAVVMKSGRIAVFPSESISWMSALGKGSYRLALCRSGKDEPVAVVGLSKERSNLLLAMADGRVRRVDGMSIPVRGGPTQGVRVWSSGVIAACSGSDSAVVWMCSRQGRLLGFLMSDVRQSVGGRRGVSGINLLGGDVVVGAGAVEEPVRN